MRIKFLCMLIGHDILTINEEYDVCLRCREYRKLKIDIMKYRLQPRKEKFLIQEKRWWGWKTLASRYSLEAAKEILSTIRKTNSTKKPN